MHQTKVQPNFCWYSSTRKKLSHFNEDYYYKTIVIVKLLLYLLFLTWVVFVCKVFVISTSVINNFNVKYVVELFSVDHVIYYLFHEISDIFSKQNCSINLQRESRNRYKAALILLLYCNSRSSDFYTLFFKLNIFV